MAIPLKQSTASQEVPLGFFVDSTDGDTAETALTIANTDIKLWKTGATTLASKNSGGATHISGGVYYATLDATDTATLGPLVIFVHVSGALAVRVECIVLAANVYDSLIAATDKLDANAAELGGTSQTGRDIGASVLLSSGTGTGQISLASGAVTAGTVSDKTGYALSSAGIQAIWDALTSALTTASSIGKLLVDNINATISSRLASSSYTAPLDAAGIRTAVGLASANLDTQLGALPTAAENADAVWDEALSGHATAGTAGKAVSGIDTAATAIKTKTDNLPASPAAAGDIPTAAAVATSVLTTAMTEAYSTDGGAVTVAQALYEMLAMMQEKSVASTTLTAKKRDGTTTAMTFTLDDATSPTSITRAT